MLKALFPISLAIALASCGSPQEASDVSEPVYPTVHIAIDKSDSPKFANDEAFARALALRIGNEVLQLPIGTHVSVRTFGALNGDNNLHYSKQINLRSVPRETVAREVAQLIMREATSGTADQTSTEIITTLLTRDYGCSAGDSVWLLSDAIETGRVRSASAVLDGTEAFLEPGAGALAGCSVQMFGFGRTSSGSLTSEQVDNLQAAWDEWMQVAGADFRTILNP